MDKYIFKNEYESKDIFIKFWVVLGTLLTILGIIQKRLSVPLILGAILEIIVIMISEVVLLKNGMISNVISATIAASLSGLAKVIINFSKLEKQINIVFSTEKLRKNWGVIVILLLLAMIVLILYKLFNNTIRKRMEENREKYYKIAHILSALGIVVSNLYCYNFANGKNIDILFMLNLVITVMYCIFSLGTLSMFNKYEVCQKKLEYQYYHNKTLDYLMKDLRRFKHDYNNMLAVIGGYLQIKDYKALNSYFNSIAGNIRYSNYDSNKSILKIKNAGILGLILYKLDLAQEKSIQFTMKVDVEIDKLGGKVNEFCEILGILLDNAIEAANETESKKIELDICGEECNRVFVIKNSIKNRVDVDKIYEREYSTKGLNRGIGLSVVSELIQNNDNMHLDTESSDSEFVQKLILKLEN